MATERIELRRVVHRIDTAAEWEDIDPILANGEFGIEEESRQFKIGDGVTPWTILPYAGLRRPPGPAGFISEFPENRLKHADDGGHFVQEFVTDLSAIFNDIVNN